MIFFDFLDEKLKLLEEYEKGDNRHDLEKRAGGKVPLIARIQ